MPTEPVTGPDLADLPATCLVQGRWSKADIHRVRLRGEDLVVKSFARKSAFVRWLGRLQNEREARAYGAVAGITGVPALRGRPDPETLVLEFVEGERLTHIRLEPRSKRPEVERLRRLIEAIHERGVAHLDLRGRDNILIDAAGTVRVIDFAAAHVAPAGSWRRRFVFPLLRSIDRSAFLKWKALLTPEDLTDRERRKLRRYRRLRRLWFLNRKELGLEDRERLQRGEDPAR